MERFQEKGGANIQSCLAVNSEKAKEIASEAGTQARACARKDDPCSALDIVEKTGAQVAKIDFLTSMKEHMGWLNFSVATFDDADHQLSILEFLMMSQQGCH